MAKSVKIGVLLLVLSINFVSAQTTWYSYQSGNWGNALSWTLDGASAPTFVNPGSNTPQSGDRVILRNNHTITMRNADGSVALNDVPSSATALSSLEIRGGSTLDLQSTTGHHFTTIRGAGTIKVAGEFVDNGATDYYLENLPAGDYTLFADRLLGGTIEYNTGTNNIPLVLNAAIVPFDNNTATFLIESNQTVSIDGSTVRNISRRSIINMGDSDDRAILQRNIAQTANLRITQGNFQIHGDNTEPFETNNGAPLAISNTNLVLNIDGNVIIETNGVITTGTANNRHQFNLNGDLTNDGTQTTSFTQLSNPSNSTPTNGIIDLNFLNGTENQELICNGPTNLYRIEINKGTQSVELSITAGESGGNSHFRLYGQSNISINANLDASSTNNNAFGLLTGAVRLGENVFIPVLCSGSIYSVGSDASLIVDGGLSGFTGGNAFVLYGTVEVNGGEFFARGPSGITTRETGTLKVSGGGVYLSQFRTSTNGPTAGGGYEQTGGEVTIGSFNETRLGTTYNSSTPFGGFYTLSLTYTTNVFIMTDGVLNVNRPRDNSQGSIFINSDPGNINVTGGTVNVTSTNDGEAKITSRAPFYNLNILNTTTATTRKVVVGSGTSGTTETITNPDLIVLNDLTIETGTTRTSGVNTFGSYLDLCPNNTCSNLEIGRNLTIQDNAVLDVYAWNGSNNNGSATVTFNRVLPGILYVGDITTYTNALLEYQDAEGSGGAIDGNWPVASTGKDAPQTWNLPLYNWVIDKPGTTLSLASKLPGKGYGAANPSVYEFKNSNGGKNVSSFLGRLVRVSNELQLLNGTLDQIDPLSTVTFVNNSGTNSSFYGSNFGSIGDQVGYTVLILTNNITNNGNFFLYEDGITPKEGIIEIQTNSDLTLQTTPGAFFGNIRFQPNLSSPQLVNIISDVEFGRVEYWNGIIDIGANNMKADVFEFFAASSRLANAASGQSNYGPNSDAGESPFNYIRMDGDQSDGGLSIKVPRSVTSPIPDSDEFEFLSASEATTTIVYNQSDRIWFPVGTDASGSDKYTPALVHLHTNGTTDGDEYITVRVVDNTLATTASAGGDILSYYWNVDFEGFGPGEEPTVSWLFQYDQTDVVGTESTYVPGKVVNNGTYQRSYDGTTQAVKNGGSTTVEGNILGSNPQNIIIFNGFNASSASPVVITNQANDDIDGLTQPVYQPLSNGASVSSTWNAWPSSGFTLENANYTAGASARFLGSPRVFYTTNTSRSNWDNQSKWSLTDDGNDDGNTGVPGTGDIAVLKSYGNTNQNHWVNVNTNITVAEVIFDNDLGGWSPRAWVTNRNAILDLGPVSGSGTFFLEVIASQVPSFVGNTDLGNFSSNESSVFSFKIDADNQVVDMPASISEYPNIRIEAGNGAGDDDNRILQTSIPIQINGYVRMDRSPRWRINHDVTIGDDLRITWQENRTTVEIGDDREVTLDIGGNLRLENGSGNDAARLLVKNDNLTSYEHRIIVRGGIEIESNLQGSSSLDLYNGAFPNNNAILELKGDNNATFINNSSGVFTPDLYKVVMNKGADVISIFSFDSDFNIPLPSTINTSPIEILKGTLVLNDPGIDITLSDASTGDFYLPNTQRIEASSGSGGLEIRQGVVRIDGNNTGMILDGPLVLSGGDADFIDGTNNTFIEYSSSGNASISITDNNSLLQVGSQIRRSTLSTSGILDLTITAGELEIGNGTYGVTSRAMLEILNTGSSFTHTGGTIRFFRQNGTTASDASIASLFLDPGSSNISGTATIEIDLQNGDPRFAINSTVALNNLSVLSSGGVGSEVVQLKNRPLTVNGDLTVSDDITFQTNNLDLTLNGNLTFEDASSYVPGTNTTTFGSADAASLVAGSSVPLSFFTFIKAGGGDLDLTGGDITITGANFDLLEGTFADNDNLINFSGQVMKHNAIHASLTGGTNKGIVFNGSDQQTLSTDSEGYFGNLTIDNSNGVALPDINQQFYIDSTLTLNQGILDIGPALITLTENGRIVNSIGEGDTFDDFSENAQIQTNSSIIDFGLQKIFPIGSQDPFLFPVGEATRYTPTLMTFNSPTTTAGSLRVRPRNRIAPVMESEVLATQELVLQYHWILNSEGFDSNLNIDLTFNYDDEVLGTGVEANYLGAIAYFNDPDLTIEDGLGSIDIANNTFTIPIALPLAQLSDPLNFSGEFFAGNPNDIPDEFKSLIFDNQTGDMSMKNIANYFQDVNNDGLRDSPGEDLTGDFASDIVGSAVEIADNLTMQIDDEVTFSRLIIPTTAIIEVDYTNPDVFNVQLGQVTGNGTISIVSDNANAAIPPGDYSSFFRACGLGGGALQYGGSGSYSILAETNRVRQLTLIGSGSKTFPSNLVTICEDLILNSGMASLADGASGSPVEVAVLDDLLIQGGTLQFGENSMLDVSDDVVLSGGTTIGKSGATIEIAGDLSQSGAAVISMTGVNRGTFKMDGSAAQNISGDFNGANSIGNLTITNSSTTGVTIANGIGNRVRVNNNLTLTDGILFSDVPPLTDPIVPEELLILSSTATVSGASASSFVDGVMRKENLATSANFSFPVGDNGFYAPVSINSPNIVTNWTAMYRNVAPPRRGFIDADFNEEISELEYWVLDGTTPGVSANTSVTYGTQSGVSNAIGLVLALLKDLTPGSGFSDETWTRVEANNSGSNNNTGTLSTTNPISFSTNLITLGEQLSSALPVTLVYFKARLDEHGQAILEWQTATEINNDYFQLEKSSDGKYFETVGIIAGYGDSKELINYEYVDNHPYSGLSYYRLKQVDFDGKFEYLPMVALTNQQKTEFSATPYPSPVLGNSFTIGLTTSDMNTPIHIQLLALDGRKLFDTWYATDRFTGNLEVNAPQEIGRGLYLLVVDQGFARVIKRVVFK